MRQDTVTIAILYLVFTVRLLSGELNKILLQFLRMLRKELHGFFHFEPAADIDRTALLQILDS